MTRRYNFDYQEEKYILKDTNPNKTDEPFIIDAKDMQFDTRMFYTYIFSDVKEQINIEIQNNIQADVVGTDVAKKGERVYRVINDLCKEITSRINKECFCDVGENEQN